MDINATISVSGKAACGFIAMLAGSASGLAILKGVGWLDWSWGWVLAPLWFPVAVLLAVASLAVAGYVTDLVATAASGYGR